ncbi:MAG: hypothetical protein PHH43_00530 [Candidatus Cloacimonetes bacterium]|nr:hypothetical protein [Candidatus Cloacimonadota bacterium]
MGKYGICNMLLFDVVSDAPVSSQILVTEVQMDSVSILRLLLPQE